MFNRPNFGVHFITVITVITVIIEYVTQLSEVKMQAKIKIISFLFG